MRNRLCSENLMSGSQAPTGTYSASIALISRNALASGCLEICREPNASAWRLIKQNGRSGVTILEVLFAIGIAIIGLLGIASILPLAGRQASDSNRAAEAQALG